MLTGVYVYVYEVVGASVEFDLHFDDRLSRARDKCEYAYTSV